MAGGLKRYTVETWGLTGVRNANEAFKRNVLLFKGFEEPSNPNAVLSGFVHLTEREAQSIWKEAEFYGTFSITPATKL